MSTAAVAHIEFYLIGMHLKLWQYFIDEYKFVIADGVETKEQLEVLKELGASTT